MQSMNQWCTDLDKLIVERMEDITREERQTLMPLINVLVEIAAVAQEKSILVLCRMLDSIEDSDLKTGLDLLADGNEVELVLDRYRQRIISSDICGVDLLRLMMIGSAIHAMMIGRSPQQIQDLLCLYVEGNYLDSTSSE